MSNTFKSWARIKKGQRFKIIKHRNNGGGRTDAAFPLNKTLITQKGGSGYSNYVYDIVKGYGGCIYAEDCILVNETIGEMTADFENLSQQEKKEIESIEKKYKSLKEELQLKINFCKEAKLEAYDENVHKVYKALQTLNNKSTDGEKAKVIAELIKK